MIEDDDEILKISNAELRKHFVRKRLEKICSCKNRTILVDKENRILECSECGAVLDAFDVVVEIMDCESRYFQNIKALKFEKEELIKWLANNRMGKALRDIARNIRMGLIPYCPHCNEPFDLERLNSWCSREYAEFRAQEMFKTKIKKEKENESQSNSQRR